MAAYTIKQQQNGLLISGLRDFSLREILDCGQCFRWLPQDGDETRWSGIAMGKRLEIQKLGEGEFLFLGTNQQEFEEIWADYFDLQTDYAALKSALCCDPVMAEATTYAPGIRVLRQNGWEALCTFIISQNNNIKRIKGIVQRLCEQFGDRLPDGTYAFPDAEKMASLTADDLAPLRAGFRNRYLVDAARKVADGDVDLEKCRSCDYDEARRELMQITGVGVKVADCALLFGLHRIEAFPLDVWMKRAMATLFPGMTPGDFGQYAGIAQQYIFHYSRMNPKLFEQT